jgi:hypothetical protein
MAGWHAGDSRVLGRLKSALGRSGRRQVCSPSNGGLARSAVDLGLPGMIQAPKWSFDSCAMNWATAKERCSRKNHAASPA